MLIKYKIVTHYIGKYWRYWPSLSGGPSSGSQAAEKRARTTEGGHHWDAKIVDCERVYHISVVVRHSRIYSIMVGRSTAKI